MSTVLSRLRRALPAVLLLLAVASTVSACAEWGFVPDNSPHSPNFHSFTTP